MTLLLAVALASWAGTATRARLPSTSVSSRMGITVILGDGTPGPGAFQEPAPPARPRSYVPSQAQLQGLDGFLSAETPDWGALETTLLGAAGERAAVSRAAEWKALAARRLSAEPGLKPSRALTEALAEVHRLKMESFEAVDVAAAGRLLERSAMSLPEDAVAQPGDWEAFSDDWTDAGLFAALKRRASRRDGKAEPREAFFNRAFVVDGEIYAAAGLRQYVDNESALGLGIFKLEGTRWTRASPSLRGQEVNALARFRGRLYAATNGGLFAVKRGFWRAVRAVSEGRVSSLAVHDGKLWAAGRTGLWIFSGGKPPARLTQDTTYGLSVVDGGLHASVGRSVKAVKGGALRDAYPWKPTQPHSSSWHSANSGWITAVAFAAGRWYYAGTRGLRAGTAALDQELVLQREDDGRWTPKHDSIRFGLDTPRYERFSRTSAGLYAVSVREVGVTPSTLGRPQAMRLGEDGRWSAAFDGEQLIHDLVSGPGLLWWAATSAGLRPLLAPLDAFEEKLGALLKDAGEAVQKESVAASARAEVLQDETGRDLFAP